MFMHDRMVRVMREEREREVRRLWWLRTARRELRAARVAAKPEMRSDGGAEEEPRSRVRAVGIPTRQGTQGGYVITIEHGDVVLFHSALGLTGSVRRWAARLEALGWRARTPDLNGGRVFDDVGEAWAYTEEVGIPEFMRRTEAALDGVPEDAAYVGFSRGAASAEYAALVRGARGVALAHGALPPSAFGFEAWPSRVPVRIFQSEADPWVDASRVAGLRAAVEGAGASCEVTTFPGSAHLFAEEASSEYRSESAERLFQEVASFLGGLRASNGRGRPSSSGDVA